ncbi:hypothetical protein INR49_029674 [Caranx melampygus]|nr:hypothetical protein INR49_029674 [Caranx melampygus]
MFRNNYQGGAVVEVFSGQGKDPVAKWKLCGGPSAIYKEYNKEVKGFVYCLEGSSQTVKMQMPECVKMPHMFLSGAGLMDLIPRSCQFPPDVHHVTQMLSMESLQKAETSAGLVKADCVLYVGTPGRLQPHPPADKQGSRKPQVLSAGRERPESSDEVIAAEESSRAAPNPAECLPCAIRPGSSSDLQVWSSWESNEGSEPQLSLQEEVFIFSSQPHSPKGGQGQGDQEKIEMGDDKDQRRSGRRHEAQPEDDFIGSESDEDKSFPTFQQQRTGTESNPATPRAPDPTLYVHVQVHSKSSHKMDQASAKELPPAMTNTHTQPPSSGRSELAGMVPTRCLSPGATLERKCGPCGSEVMDQALAGKSSVRLSRKLLQEAILADFPHHKEEEDEKLEPVDSSHYDLHLLGSHRMHGDDDDEELRMLASLKREQEEDECRASGLRVSQIHQCNVSISMSSDDASTWTHISMPATQGHHYQNEINPLLHSNPREWMDVLSPPIMAPSQQRRSGNTCNNKENQVAGVDESVNEEEAQEDEYLNLLYDPCLNCYFDPKTGKSTRMSSQQARLRLHPGIIASVIFVSAVAMAALVLIIRKYCFPVNEAAYRYSLLRRMEDQGSAVTDEDGDRGLSTVGEESDEDLLE